MHSILFAATAGLFLMQSATAVNTYLFGQANCKGYYIYCSNIGPATCCQGRGPEFASAAWFGIPQPDGVAVYEETGCTYLVNYSPHQPGGNVCLTPPGGQGLSADAYFNPQHKRSADVPTCTKRMTTDKAGFEGRHFNLTGMSDKTYDGMIDWFKGGKEPLNLKSFEIAGEKLAPITEHIL